MFTNKSTIEKIDQKLINSDFGILLFCPASSNNFDIKKYQNEDGTPNDLAVQKIYECLKDKHRSVFFGSMVGFIISPSSEHSIRPPFGLNWREAMSFREFYGSYSISIFLALKWIYNKPYFITEKAYELLKKATKKQYPACYKALERLILEIPPLSSEKYMEDMELLESAEREFISFKAQLPIFIARLFYRHRGINFTERSGRYTAENTQFYKPDNWRKAPLKATQGSIKNEFVEECNAIIQTEGDGMHNILEMFSDGIVKNDDVKTQLKQLAELINNSVVFECDYENLTKHNMQWFENNLENKMCKEQARMILPQSQITTTINTVDLCTLSSILSQRLDKHAQLEIREVAQQLYDIACEEFGKELVDKLIDIQNRMVF
jgi:thymidylate synthase ThyX